MVEIKYLVMAVCMAGVAAQFVVLVILFGAKRGDQQMQNAMKREEGDPKR